MKVAVRVLALVLGCCFGSLSTLAATESASERAIVSEHKSKHLVVEWRADSSCGDARRVADLVEELLGDNLAERSDARAAFEITVTANRYHVELEFSDGARRGRRSFDVESCDAALDASTLVLAFVLEPDMQREAALLRLTELHDASSRLPYSQETGEVDDVDGTPNERATEPSASVPSASVPIPIPPRVESESQDTSRFGAGISEVVGKRAASNPVLARSATRMHVASRLLVDTATLPSWSAGFAVGVGLDHASMFVEISGRILAPRDTSMPGDSARGASIQLMGGEARLCSVSRGPNATLVFRPCTSAILAAVVGDAFGGTSRHAAETYFAWALGGDAALRIRSDVSITSGLDVVVPVRRVAVVVNGVDRALHRTPVALQTWLGVSWSF
jgi:hypothetical protein